MKVANASDFLTHDTILQAETRQSWSVRMVISHDESTRDAVAQVETDAAANSQMITCTLVHTRVSACFFDSPYKATSARDKGYITCRSGFRGYN